MSPSVRTKPRLLVRGGALLGSAVVVAMVTGPTAYAASGSGGGVDVVNTETVQVYMDADAHPTSKRVYEQLGLTGDGKVDLRNPIATRGLRNLDGFSSVDVKRGDQVVDTTVHGEKSYRTVSDYTGKLPLGVEVEYTLDGKRVQPGDVVGKSGELTVTYTVTNRTAESQQVTWKDGDGNDRTTTEDVVVPMVGTLTTTVPNRFRDVSSKEANMAGDGKGGTTLSYTMTLFPPIGAPSATFGYTAKITDGVIPPAEINALPVDPLESPTFSKAAESYQGGAASGRELTEGASTIDANLLKLRDGANELLGGIVQLRDGSTELSDGLGGKLAPGGKQLSAGQNVLTAGLFKLVRGNEDLNDGTGQALAGGKKLSGGLRRISGGLDQLHSQLTSPESRGGMAQIREGIVKLQGGVGDPDAPANDKTLIGGLKLLTSTDPQKPGLPVAKAGATQLKGGLVQLKGNGDPTDTVNGGISAIQKGIAGAKVSIDDKTADGAAADKLVGGLTGVKNGYCPLLPAPAQPGCNDSLQQLIDGASQSKAELKALSAGLGSASTGLSRAVAGLGSESADGTLINGAARLEAGVGSASEGASKLQAAASTLIAPGLQQLLDGYDQLTGKLGEATAGVGLLDDGASTASTGMTALTDGIGDIDAGSGKILAGTRKAYGGSTKLEDGADALSAGITAAAAGSDKLTAGLRKAATSAPQLPEGAQKLSTQGSKKLIEAGRDTTRTYAQNVAVIAASAERANSHSMINGAPEDASSLSAYSFKLAGADGEGSRNLVRTLGGAAVLAASGGVLLLRRRFLG
ncbi:hypothetical protein GCM10011519_02180 [Marmoricola endophyticus]|uniref:Gram-positive cocci surface proteins LPxTG domain-containing protein n=1 Tax=Marmoricola endophyticus TaxID=2040280 RepID=A0A917B931_9ACTN|nr:hypothetical protein [Marmoricola endophyticus]GGF32344.1 hypothetical protein GCM10011519_02180 [Marmoricola endophyticus]